jgi:hypothetical protein
VGTGVWTMWDQNFQDLLFKSLMSYFLMAFYAPNTGLGVGDREG